MSSFVVTTKTVIDGYRVEVRRSEPKAPAMSGHKLRSGRSSMECYPSGKWEQIRQDSLINLSLRKERLRQLRLGLLKAPVTAADFRHSALPNAVKVGK